MRHENGHAARKFALFGLAHVLNLIGDMLEVELRNWPARNSAACSSAHKTTSLS
jgi:hypothetical protein